jgi:putative membrane protein
MQLALPASITEEECAMTFTTNLSIAALAAALTLAAAAQEPQNRSIVTAEAPPARASTNPQQIEFLGDALRTSLGWVRFGELAAQQSYDQSVRDYGTKLKSDHTAHATEIERRLEPLGVTIPTEPSAEALSQIAALTRLTGEEFDAAFVQMMIWTHTDAIEQYGAQTHANPDRSLHDFATMSLPMLREHLARAESLR